MSSAPHSSPVDFTKDGVNPDVISVNPTSHLKVTYGRELEVTPGATLSVHDTQQAPRLEWTLSQSASVPAGATQLYTVIMCDPDAPSREKHTYRNWIHWLVVNVSGPHAVNEGFEITPAYQGPAPPPKTGLHRYVFLVYRQNGVIDANDLSKITGDTPDQRGKFSVADFLAKHKFMIDGAAPIAGNYFLCANPQQ